ncbi:hypothetical protein B484DRAFT_84180 [Ochromonadaceae sp. CCMP2298]|nr:hypothetical protein B484DRAFT_10569 [Ochromonadaceae sp. CCMP2298]KAJ1442070.1 hypothetical protein B484DRAFT_84180 [Ochromonadaceae sp. CCMP2298]
MTSAVRYAIVLHRGLACSDESATDEEQAERVLYFYPESASLSQQLAKVIVLESLIDFSSRFSTQPLDSVVMQNHTWAFSECEPGVWVILGVDAQPHVSSPAEIPVAPVPQSPLPLHCNQASPFALQASAQHIYRLLRLTHGPLLKALRGPAKVGVKQGGQECRGQEAIVRVRGLRKAVRKLRLRLRQESQDAENLRSRQEILAAYEEQGSEAVAEEHMGIRDGDKTLQQAEVEIDTSNQAISHTLLQLAEALKDPHYPLPRLRDALARHLRLQISSGQWDAHCLLQGMQGVRLQGWSSPHPVLSAVLAHTGPQHASSGGGSGGDSRSSEGLDSIGLGTPPVSMAVDTDPLGTPGSGESQDASCTSAGTGGGSGGLPAGLLRLRRLVLDATDELSTGECPIINRTWMEMRPLLSLPSANCRLLSAVCRIPYSVCCLLSAICRLPSSPKNYPPNTLTPSPAHAH